MTNFIVNSVLLQGEGEAPLILPPTKRQIENSVVLWVELGDTKDDNPSGDGKMIISRIA